MTSIPILGICLGHQAIGYSFGAKIDKSGKNYAWENFQNSVISQKQLFQSLPQQLEVMRYHSLIIKKDTLPAHFEVLATSIDDDEIMAIKHREYPLYGMQFHPESIGTGAGKQILKNFLNRNERGSCDMKEIIRTFNNWGSINISNEIEIAMEHLFSDDDHR